MKILMIGLNPRVIYNIENIKDDISLYIIEEEELYRNNFKEFTSILIKGIKIGAYQQSLDCVEVACKWNEIIGFDAVIPGREYSVFAVNEIAKKLRFPRLGDLAASSMTNKYKLRNEAYKLGILQPKYKKIENYKELISFYRGKPMILKPANRQASVGVVRINNGDELKSAWQEVTNASEGNKVVTERQLKWEYIAEDFIEGHELSVETFVKDGQVLFNNITKKLTMSNKYSVELGHIVPGDFSDEEKKSIIAAKQALIQGLGVENGILHSEWMLNDKGPYLIECAGRAPGDNIPELFELSYGINLFQIFINILSGKNAVFPDKPIGVSCISYFTAQPGKLLEVIGLDELKKMDGFVRAELSVSPGHIIEPVTSNYSRMGFTIFTAISHKKIYELISDAKKTIKFKVM
ncbi:hypothetical protein SH1V18_34980 [Vallitalea longa]|uniref:ATP-grasp domain-containing protein n=1 Tax=Vallitalea longa TaxID=2936439 RepID=A0A9W5YH15_9FIRM|nr:ATP-grasp domain-containing protein [Vallitalea longa]GKX31018.1 hypothetical protein SH1V18_34980 [Vallitalea longa]